MLQILHNLKTGKVSLTEIPEPLKKPLYYLIRTETGVISAGTERTLIDFGKSGSLEKAKNQPDKVKQVIEKAKTDGLVQTINAIKSKPDEPLPLGYFNVGTIIEAKDIEQKAKGIEVGDRVANNGPHAEIVSVAHNLCAKVPDEVSDEEAAFTVPSAIGLQGIRLVQPTLGEALVVTGLRLIGQLTVQLLLAHGPGFGDRFGYKEV